MKKRNNFTLYIKDDLFNIIKHLSASQGRSIAQQINYMLSSYLLTRKSKLATLTNLDEKGKNLVYNYEDEAAKKGDDFCI